MRKKILTLLLGSFVLTLAACQGDCEPPPPPPDGFRINTTYERYVDGVPMIFTHYDVGVFGRWGFDLEPTATGDKEFSGNSGSAGYVDAAHGRAPAAWTLGEINGPCGGKIAPALEYKGKEDELRCIELIGGFFGTPFPFFASPSSVGISSPPADIKILGQGFSTAYGMPVVEYYNDAGGYVGQSVANYVSDDGSWLSGAPPDLSSCYNGDYTLMVKNRKADGSLESLGGAGLHIYNDYQQCVDQDGDGSCAGDDCNDYDGTVYPGAPTYCQSGEDRDCNGVDDYTDCYGYGGGCDYRPSGNQPIDQRPICY